MADKVTLNTSGDFKNITKYLKKEKKIEKIGRILEEYGKKGVEELAAATPKDSGLTADSWEYKIKLNTHNQTATLEFWNNNKVSSPNYRKGRPVPVALLIQYGHGIKGGGFVQGRDYINPVLQPLFDDIAKNVWKEVTSV